MKRVGIFVFYDGNGVVHDYVPYLLEGLKPHFEELLVVVNGALTEEGRKRLSKFTDKFLMRDNKGLDTWAYKEGMDYFGWDVLTNYDEVVIFNDTIMGPVFPFSEMFDEMDKREVDFWGITRHHRDPVNPYGNEYGYIPAHVQSYFTAFRKSFIDAKPFRDYWDNLFPVNSYADAVGKHETVFTKKFEDMGFRWDTYIHSSELEMRHSQPVIAYGDYIVEKYRCPVFKKRLFFQDYNWIINSNVGQVAKNLLGYLKEETTYPTELVYESLIGARNLKELSMN